MDVASESQGATPAPESSRSATAEASKQRIASHDRWYKVLDVSIIASVEDIKAAFRKLSLLHHPDKGGDADTFKRVRTAYEEGMLKRRVGLKPKVSAQPKAKASAKAKADGKSKGVKSKTKGPTKAASRGTAATSEKAPAGMETETVPTATATQESSKVSAPDAKSRSSAKAKAQPSQETSPKKAGRGVKRPWPKPVPANATKAKIKQAVKKWDDSTDYKVKTMPDEVLMATPDEMYQWLQTHSCAPLDAREGIASSTPCTIRGASRLSYVDLITSPEDLASQISALHEAGAKLVIFTQHGERMGTCGLLGSLLIDVFAFDANKVFRLDGGYDKWQAWVESNPVAKAEEELMVAVSAQAASEARVTAAKGEHAAWSDLVRERFNVLIDGTCDNEADARIHLAKLAPKLGALQLEESANAMLQNAAIKVRSKRGKFDEMIFEEVQSRLTKKVSDLFEIVSTCQADFAERSAAADRCRSTLAELQSQGTCGDQTQVDSASAADTGADESAAQEELVEPESTIQEDAVEV